jgi:hypothetical protein
LEFSGVADQDQVIGPGLGGDPEIVGADDGALLLQRCTDLAVVIGGLLVQGEQAACALRAWLVREG